MRYFPLFFDLKDRRVIVVGGGEKAAQKLRLLLKTPARLEIIAPSLNLEISALVTAGKAQWVANQFEPCQLNGASLVYATQNKPENLAVAKAARARNIPVNAVDMPDLCDVITPAIVDRHPLVVAIGTQGCAPVLARRVKSHLEGWLPQNLGAMATTARRLRKAVIASLPNEKLRRTFWERFWPDNDTSQSFKASCQKEFGSAEAILKTLMHDASTGTRGRISLVGTGPGDVDLLTFRALQCLQQADIIVFDNVLNADIYECARRDAERICLTGLPGPVVLRATKISNLLVRLAAKGKHVVHLNFGNFLPFRPTVSEKNSLKSHHITLDYVPGLAPTLKSRQKRDFKEIDVCSWTGLPDESAGEEVRVDC
jgi:uroporphyrin-III C-methyltransferase / precorrin-2 dehydrogenase / sirohydrochlorin ferrochelatase